jgi:hypothetical protein
MYTAHNGWGFRDFNGAIATDPSGRAKVWACGRSLDGIVGSNPASVHGCLSLVSDVFCQVEVSASRLSLLQRSPTKCGVSEWDHESSTLRRPWPKRDVAPW